MIVKIIFLIISIHLLTITATPIHSPVEYIGKFPYHVSIRDPSGKHICGGAIVKTNVILAPGLCMNHGYADHIVAGSVDPTDTDANTTQTIKIVKTERNIGIFGEKYMVLYFLDNSLNFGYGVEPIKISNIEPDEYSNSRVSGFVKNSNYKERKLHSVELKISNYSDCKEFLNHPIYNDIIVCTATTNKNDVCSAYEETSLLVCFGKERQLCGLPFSYRNFICDYEIDNSIKADKEIEKEEDDKVYIAGFIKVSAFRDWLMTFDIM